MVLSHVFQKLFVVGIVISVQSQCLFGAQPQPPRDDNQNRPDDNQRNNARNRNPFYFPQFKETSKLLQRFDELDWMDRKLEELQAEFNRNPTDDMRNRINALIRLRQESMGRLHRNPYGRAIAMGLAGNNWKAIQDEDIQSPVEGAAVGVLMSGSKVLSKHLENSIEDVVGGTWDGAMHLIKSCFASIRDFLFYDDEHPFDPKTLKAWQGIIDASFKDLERVLKDGLQSSGRALDTTLRVPDQAEPGQDTPEQEAPLKAWAFLAESYIRQFDFLISRVDKHIKYYDENNITYFLAQELKTQLVGVNKLLTKSGTLKDLDSYVDSNKSLIPAFRQNIANVLTRLIESVEPRPVNGASASRSTASRDFGSRSEGRFRDDDDLPTSMRNGWV